MNPKLTKKLTVAGIVVANAAVGTLLTDTKSVWYRTLKKPPIQPPPLAFPIAWTSLYADIAYVVGASVADARGREETALWRAFLVNAGLNAAWSGIFFRAKNPGLATIEAAALAASSADLARRCIRIDNKRGWALAPYAAWTSFATVLSAALWWGNR